MKIQPYKFSSGKEMLDQLQTMDLYSPSLETYVFLYNEAGGIAYYSIDSHEAIRLAVKSQEADGEYWAAFLGRGGYICDDPSDVDSPPSPGNSNIEYCQGVYSNDWIDTRDVIKYYAEQAKR